PKGEGWGEGLQTLVGLEPPHPNPLPRGERESGRATFRVRVPPRCSAVAIDRLRIEGLVAFERKRHCAILAERHHAIEARAPAGVAGTGTVLLDLDPDRILIAIDAHLDNALSVAGLLALAPELLARAAVVPGVAGCNRLGERLRIH